MGSGAFGSPPASHPLEVVGTAAGGRLEFTWYYHADLYERSTVEVTPGNTAVLLCTGGIALATVLVTVSPVLRNFPRYETNSDNDETHAMEGAIKHG